MVIWPRIMPGALHVPDTRLPCWMSVQVVALEGPPIPLPMSDPDESEATALQVPDTDGDPLLPDDVMEDEGLVARYTRRTVRSTRPAPSEGTKT